MNSYKMLVKIAVIAMLALSMTIGIFIVAHAQGTESASLSSISESLAQEPPPPARAPDIVGGEEAQPGAWPWQIGLSYDGDFFCGGVLIDPDWVLTAKHCIEWGDPSGFQVTLGDHNRDQEEDTEQVIDVAEIIPHPSADLALLRLASTAQLTDRVQTIALATAPFDNGLSEPGVSATITGWGYTTEGGEVSSVLRQASVPIVSNAICNEAYYGGIGDGELCAGFAEGGVDTCGGDSGGPLVVSDGQGGWKLAGVTSWGDGCARPDAYGVYVRVASYAMWVSAYVNPETRYQLVAKHSNKCLDVEGGPSATEDGANVQQWECLNPDQPNQLWTLNPLDDSYYGSDVFRIKAVHSGKCLDVVGGSYQNGANVIQSTCDDTYNSNQLWRHNPVTDANHVMPLSGYSYYCLDVAGGPYATDNGVNVLQYGCFSDPPQTNQLWYFVPSDEAAPSGDFIAPAPGAQVSAPVLLKVQARDNEGGLGVARVVFASNASGSWQVIGVDAVAPFELEWDMAGIPDGQTFQIGAEIYDHAGNRSVRAQEITKVKDTKPPTGEFTAPAPGVRVARASVAEGAGAG